MIKFITSNEKKASDFKLFGFIVQEFQSEVPEIKSNDVETVAVYKAKDSGLNNIVVEDTALYVEGSHFFGTDIKHVCEEIQNDPSHHGFPATWKLSLCLKKDDYFYISTGELVGKLHYPPIEEGYHFEKFFAIETDKGLVHYPLLDTHTRQEISPRYIALRKLHHAIMTEDFSELKKVHVSEIPEWDSDYQVEKKTKNKQIKF